MKLQNLTIIFIIIVLPVILLTSFYIATGLKTIRYQGLYDTGLITATQDAIQAFEINTLNNKYSDNPETKRSIIKSSIKMLETSLSNTCNISAYNKNDIEEYIPAIMFGMYDGFYLYAPSYNPTSRRYEHSLKNYVYYAETLDKDKGIIIRYYLDSYVHVSGYFTDPADTSKKIYQTKEGYLINIDQTIMQPNKTKPTQISYYGTNIDMKDQLAVNYFVDNYEFSAWFKYVVLDELGSSAPDYLQISEDNDPEDPNSKFAQHRNGIIRSKIEGVLNSTITAYSQRTWNQNYKMPELTEEDWEKIYSDISVTTFFQGKKIGFTKYNGYCVLNSNNHYELINPNLLYFSTDDDNDKKINTGKDYYHDIRCTTIKDQSSIEIDIGSGNKITTLRGWKIGRFQKLNKKDDAVSYDPDSTELTLQPTYNKYSLYMYERAECACYECINGTVGTTSIYDYIKVADAGSATDFIKKSYWTSLARERAKLHREEPRESNMAVEKKVNGLKSAVVVNGETVEYTITITNNASTNDTIREIIDEFDPSNIIVKSTNISLFKRIKSDGTESIEDEKLALTTIPNGLKWAFGESDGEGIDIALGEKIVITYQAVIKGTIGNKIVNTVRVLPGYSDDYVDDSAECTIRKSGVTVEKLVNPSSVEYGGQVEYTIRIKNEGSYVEKIDIVDDWIDSRIVPDFSTVSYAGYEHKSGENKMSWSNITINPGQEMNITFKANINGDIGDTITNWVRVYVPTTKETKIAEAYISSTVKKTINTKATNKDFKVILVLDASTSMSGRIGDIRDAAKEVINAVGAERVKIVRFAQSSSVISSLSEYVMVADGISTNYVAGLNTAAEIAKNYTDTNTYVVFMSDGGPTNTQGINWNSPLTAWDEKNLVEKIAAIAEFVAKFGTNTITSIIGGWMECDWTGGLRDSGDETYAVRLLWTTELAEMFMGIFGQDDFDAAITDKLVAKAAWQNHILPKLDVLKAYTKHISTFYYDTGGGNAPYYGLSQMATTINDSYKANNKSDAIAKFREMAQKMLEFESEKTITNDGATITLDYYKDISKIQIGTRTYIGSDLENIKSQIQPVAGTEKGILNLNTTKHNGNAIFKTDEEVKIYYGE